MKKGLLQKTLKWAAVVLAVVFTALQLVRPARTNPPVDEARTLEAHARVPLEVASILDRSCNDCHSHQTRWPWYSNVAPVSWYVVEHVNEGRDEMNFSDWAQYSQRQQAGLLRQICREITNGAMPLRSYLRMHHDAELSREDVKTLCDWADAESRRISQASSDTR